MAITAKLTGKAGDAEVDIRGEITAESAAILDRELKALGPVTHLTIYISSPGGDVFAGNAMFAMLARNPARKTVIIEGLAASMASLIAMVGHRIIMPANAMLMIHDPRALAAGKAGDMTRMAGLLENLRAGMVTEYAKRSKLAVAQVEKLMAEETWLTAEEAVKLGFADELERPMAIAAAFDLTTFGFKHPPAAPKSMADLATAYWGSRGKAVTSGVRLETPAEEFARMEATKTDVRSLCPDLVAVTLDARAIWGRYNGAGNNALRNAIVGGGS